MHKIRIQALLVAITVTLTAVTFPVQVLATSVTDLEQQASDAVNKSLMNNYGVSNEDSEAAAEEKTEKESDDDTGANTVDLTQEKPENYTDIEIDSLEDFIDVVEHCHYDKWSRDKYITLNTDLDFGFDEFPILETFGGVFDGNGHSIRGLSMTGCAGETGLFGTIQNTGVVKNLNVQGIIAPEDDENKLGGIAGYNYGWVEGCSFDGRIVADSQLGGIVGRNGQKGTVISCTASGSITGKAACGGIVGYNEGTISGCTNSMNVNTSYKDSSVTMDQLQRILDKILKSGSLLNAENLEINSDTGGIAGFSSGVITSCVNKAEIGYDHVGYNVGGIAGRNSGYLANNTNDGLIKGRKDVGGIAGQLSPYLAVDFAEDTLNKLDQQLDELNDLVNVGLDNADAYSDNTTGHLSNINGLSKIAQDAAKGLADEGSRQYDETVGKINNATTAMQSSLSTFADVAEKIGVFARRSAEAVGELNDEISIYLDGVNMSDEDRAKFHEYQENLNEANARLNEDTEKLNNDLNGQPVEQEKYQAVKEDLEQISTDYQNMKDSISNLNAIMETSKDENLSSNTTYQNLQSAQTILDTRTLTDAVENANKAMEENDLRSGDLAMVIEASNSLQSSLDDRLGNNWDNGTTIDWNQVKNTLPSDIQGDERADQFKTQWERYIAARKDLETTTKDLNKIYNDSSSLPIEIKNNGKIELNNDYTLENYFFEYISSDLSNIASDISDISDATSGMMEVLQPYLENATKTGGMAEKMASLRTVMKDYPDVSGEISYALNTLASVDLQMSPVTDTMRNHGNTLYSALNQLADEMNTLNNSMANESDEGVTNLRQITDQFDTILRTLEDAAREMKNPTNQTQIQDDSDADIADTFEGRATSSVNNGEVIADTNVGGITGMIGVEYDLNPEKDIQQSGTSSLSYIFRAKCVVDNGTNNGRISAKNSYGGGIAGHMEMGLVSSSVNYGILTGAKYVGGITGYSVGLVRNNVAKCEITGTTYVGGIAGYGVSLRDNLAMVNASDAKQYVGAIAGKVENVDPASVYDNYYYSNTIYGIDSISYEGIAEGVSYQALTDKAAELNVGDRQQAALRDLQLTFMADDVIVKTINCSYGQSIEESEIPKVPEKDGFHGSWSRSDFAEVKEDEVIYAEYSRVVTLLTSGQKRAEGKPVIEVLGNFQAGDTLILTEMAPRMGERERWMVSFPEDGQEEHEIRYLVPEDLERDDTIIYIIGKGKARRAKTENNGAYLTFTAKGADVAFRVAGGKEQKDFLKIAAYGGAALAAGTVVLLAFRKKDHRKKKRKNKKNREEA